ncbi:hypothetical protein Cst_c04280 [Thermoclostridium stercorarium subsp. stercorarium DSM 8532]|uniref:Uncharacterized protein n=1 Tax=Thermoclostridium stercorarium (strain ATCC 35414 / DSM 8532 / NCIMB 11754) TaxID=1121335 RepID=L7VHD8_THES1|nr:bZIP transcription factor [Thermoclostridium stercorarium]AGC67450.1 hypothetical protein Cst_c04280 [Thermoclostridium stercorarium subsp. stercorarium DSM 8532]AGI38510.1 hypothetical protein Clst_0409 [Thermoclostridium stercorarium subsp. stercorarium DSM 8532]
MVGRKIYYELATGDVILITPEKHSENAINTTKEQDFQMYDVLAARNPDTVGVIQLEYGQYQAEFQSARSVKVDIETGQLLFEYPKYEPSLSEQVKTLQKENQTLKQENAQLHEEIGNLKAINADLTYQLMVKGVI